MCEKHFYGKSRNFRSVTLAVKKLHPPPPPGLKGLTIVRAHDIFMRKFLTIGNNLVLAPIFFNIYNGILGRARLPNDIFDRTMLNWDNFSSINYTHITNNLRSIKSKDDIFWPKNYL